MKIDTGNATSAAVATGVNYKKQIRFIISYTTILIL
jgi:hypothetical protein